MTIVKLPKKVSRLTDNISESETTERWDTNAPVRDGELTGNGDPSYRALKNIVLESLANWELKAGDSVLDVGAGLGYLSADLASRGYLVDAIDPSEASIKLAQRTHATAHAGQLVFHALSLQNFALQNPQKSYDAIVANMTLHSVSDLQGFMFAAESLLKPDGIIVATIPNPRTYLQSRSDIDVSDLDLRVEHILEIEFRIRNHGPHPAKVIFHHRPIRLYSVAADNAAIPLRESRVPEHVGPGRPRDIAVLEFDRSTRF